MNLGFDLLAKQYTESVRSLPQSYIDLVVDTFKLRSFSQIIDLGCGSGLLTFPLANVSKRVSGLDISHNMIELAKSNLNDGTINWIESDIDKYIFQDSYYDLIISYESIHLFPDTKKLLIKCSNGLKDGGSVCMGWCFYNWEVLLEKEIVSAFKNHGIIWGEWSYQKFYKFRDLIDSGSIKKLTPTKSVYINDQQEWSVNDIVEYITSISKAINLSKNHKEGIKKELTEVITSKYGQLIKGNTQFWIMYSHKTEV